MKDFASNLSTEIILFKNHEYLKDQTLQSGD